MSVREQLEEALVQFGFAPAGEARRVTDATVADLIEALRPLTAPNFACVMVGGEDGTITNRFEGLDGLAAAWHDWLVTFEWFELSISGALVESGDHVLAVGRQRAKSASAGIEIENDAAAVWTMQGDRLTGVEFHLDADTARRAAGLEPEQRA